MRCIKRNIGHLCHDEPRDSDSKKTKSVIGASTADESESQSDMVRSSIDQTANSMAPPSFNGSLGAGAGQAAKSSFDASAALGRGNPLQLVQPTALSSLQRTMNTGNMNQCRPFAAVLPSGMPFARVH